MSKNNVIPEGHETTVCECTGGKKRCSFLMFNAKDLVWECAKEAGDERGIWQRRKDGSINAMGDNCSGPPDFTPRSK